MLEIITITLIISIIIIGLIVSLNRLFYTIRKNRELLQTVTGLDRGTWSERELVLMLLKMGISPLAIFHDLYVEKYKDNYSQIDLVVATKVGIIVFEVKDYSGWIFGNGTQSNWTQILAFGNERYKFYNPIMQNNGHIKALKNKLKQCADVPFYSIIVFYGRCNLKDISSIPNGTNVVYPQEVPYLINQILENNPPANYSNKRDVVEILKKAVNNGENKDICYQHSLQINQKYSNE